MDKSHNVVIKPMGARHRSDVTDILKRVGVFNEREIRVALEVIDSYLSGSKDYTIKVAVDEKDSVKGYICYGHASLTNGAYYLYWIAVHPEHQREGIGRMLMKFMEDDVRKNGGRMILLETSSIDKYKVAREFYSANGYECLAHVKDFYDIGNDLLIYGKYFDL
ncbi:MAG: GNAT family N-acetyltransferase [Nitrososphaerota archaeon]|nr:GNAT family N-acetyltransferase [Nitrososphaerales archaeon]MCX8191771.1 GNAT family N-acetyltransferase [Nitrososphaerales archaeon]MDW8044560.1 GNAT family N-acetyltransferase [Nitrososphaerota archaeon]